MKKYIYFNLILKSKETNGIKCKNFEAGAYSLETARKQLIEELETTENDFGEYDNKLLMAFIKVNNLNSEQLKSIKLLMREFEKLTDDYTLEEYRPSYFRILNNFGELSKALGKKLKEVPIKEQLEIAIDTLTPGYYHSLEIKREIKYF